MKTIRYIELIILFIFSSAICICQSEEEVIREQVESAVRSQYGTEYTATVVIFDSLIGKLGCPVACDYITDPYGTLQGRVLFFASKDDSENSYAGIIGLYQNGSILWHSDSIIYEPWGSIIGASDINNDGRVDILTTFGLWTTQQLWILSWDGASGELINMIDTTSTSGLTFSGIMSYTGFLFVDAEGDGIKEIQGLWRLGDTLEAQEITYRWNGSKYGYWSGSAQIGSRTFLPANRMNVSVSASVSQSDTNYQYHYQFTNDSTSDQSIREIYLSNVNGITSFEVPETWRTSSWPDTSVMGWVQLLYLGNFISPGQTKAGFALNGPGLPHIVPYFIQGNVRPARPDEGESDFTVEELRNDIFTNSVQGKTIGPFYPTSPINYQNYIDTLKSYVNQSNIQGWILDSLVLPKYFQRIDSARTYFLGHNVRGTKSLLDSLLQYVAADSASTLTDEAYALLRFNTEYLNNQLIVPPLYTLTIDQIGSGSVNKSPDQSDYDSAMTVFLIAVPATGYAFSNWTGDAEDSSVTTDVVMDGNKSITANFMRIVFDVSVDTTPHGSVSPDGIVQVNYGDSARFTFTPSTGYHVDSVIADGTFIGSPSSYTFYDVTADHHLRVTFAINQYSLVATSSANGSISPSGTVQVTHGGSQSYTLTPATGYHVDSLIVDGINQGALTSYSFTNVTAPHSIRAVFAINQYAITSISGPNGSITPSGSVLVNHGANQRFTFTPSTGYHVDSVIVDGVNKPDSMAGYTFYNVTTTHTIRSVFRINTYIVTATSGANGSIAPSGTVSVNHGANQTFTLTPSTGYHVDSLLVDGVNQGQLTSYTFSNLTANHTIRVVFAQNLYTITIEISGEGTVLKYPNQATYLHGTEVRLTAKGVVGGAERSTPDSPEPTSWRFDHWELDATGTTNPVYVTMNGNKTVRAVFVPVY